MNARSLYVIAPLLVLVFAGVAVVHAPTTLPGQAISTAATSTVPPVNYARYFFGTDHVNSPATQASRWPLLIGQGDQQAGAQSVRAADPARVRTIVYANPLFVRATDPNGVTTTTDNADTLAHHSNWVLRDSSGAMVRAINFGNQDYAADIGNKAYQAESVRFLLAKIRADGWDGVFLDDTNPSPSYTFSTRPVKYPTDASWQRAEVAYVRTVCGGIQSAGYRCYLNLGQQNTTWAQTVAELSDGPMTEFFVAMNPAVGGTPSLATIENGYWLPQLSWASWAESHTIEQIVHASTASPVAADYALASYLMVTQGRGRFAVNRSYTSPQDAPFTLAMSNARKLGAAKGPAVAVSSGSGVYYRDFANGRVVVNPHDTPRTFAGTVYPPTTGWVTLR